MDERFEVSLPSELVEGMGDMMELLDFESVGEFVEAAVRRLFDKYVVLTKTLLDNG
jgi:Arc/MetJ-type ribon-helix-helix transcriptional regulator